MSTKRWTSADFTEQYEHVIKHGHDCSSVVNWLREASDALAAVEARIEELEATLLAIQTYLRTGKWKQPDGVDNMISAMLKSPARPVGAPATPRTRGSA